MSNEPINENPALKARDREDVIEDFQEAIVNAGGRFFRRTELVDMKLGELLEILYKNGYGLSVIPTKTTKSTGK